MDTPGGSYPQGDRNRCADHNTAALTPYERLQCSPPEPPMTRVAAGASTAAHAAPGLPGSLRRTRGGAGNGTARTHA